jgi:hypothetical protein
MKVAHFKCILVDVLQKSQTTEIMAIFLAAMVSECTNFLQNEENKSAMHTGLK